MKGLTKPDIDFHLATTEQILAITPKTFHFEIPTFVVASFVVQTRSYVTRLSLCTIVHMYYVCVYTIIIMVNVNVNSQAANRPTVCTLI